jgi:hypothetical protein
VESSVVSFIVSVQLLVDICDVGHKIDGIPGDNESGLAREGLLSSLVDLVRSDIVDLIAVLMEGDVFESGVVLGDLLESVLRLFGVL